MRQPKKDISPRLTEDDYELHHHGIDPQKPSASYAVSVLQLLLSIEDSKDRAFTDSVSKEKAEIT